MGAGAGDDVPGEVVDVHCSYGAGMARQVLDISEPGKRMMLQIFSIFEGYTCRCPK